MTTASTIPTGALYIALELGCDKWVQGDEGKMPDRERGRSARCQKKA